MTASSPDWIGFMNGSFASLSRDGRLFFDGRQVVTRVHVANRAIHSNAGAVPNELWEDRGNGEIAPRRLCERQGIAGRAILESPVNSCFRWATKPAEALREGG